ncbi:extensin family protein [Sphingorhabdus sp. Alg239-R122]|uniref:extensin-like domain-containing protein n=1 Tax=Sphingorhabdus sp. Alg239-R122 TaxID=2305989 RepID=UPI0013D97DBD|nr:extensin family protein [Sphingorhabdus sp. Alg239-R122]
MMFLRPHIGRFAVAAMATVLLSACGILPEGRTSSSKASAPRPSVSAAPRITQNADTRACHADLGKAKVNFTPLPDQYFGGGCSQVNSVNLSNVGFDRNSPFRSTLEVTNLGPVTCPLALNFASWAQYGVARAARQMLGSDLVRIETMGSYSCRSIAGSARLSQHAHANAIDVAAFVLADGRRISVKSEWNGSRREREFLRVVHRSACKRFGTVLGPDYNNAHRDHFHFDMSGKGYCR